MEQVERYRQIIRSILQEYAQYKPSAGDIQTELICDEAQDHYELIHAGWNRHYRIHGSVLHLDIRDGKVWIQHDGTPDDIAGELVKAGIPKEHIVLAFKAPEIRQHTGYAVS
jgi:hypothetical protein